MPKVKRTKPDPLDDPDYRFGGRATINNYKKLNAKLKKKANAGR